MYSRYTPQPDGSYRRNRMEEPRPKPQSKPCAEPQPPCTCAPPPPTPPTPVCPPPCNQMPKHANQNVNQFFKQLLPKDFDTGDLIIVLLLLLLAGDCEEDKATAMLTLVLYLFM